MCSLSNFAGTLKASGSTWASPHAGMKSSISFARTANWGGRSIGGDATNLHPFLGPVTFGLPALFVF